MKVSLLLCLGLGLTLLITSCTQSPKTTGGNGSSLSAACQTAIGLSSQPAGLNPVMAPALLTGQAVTTGPGTQTAPDWAAPHVAGEVLVIGSGQLSAQATSRLSGLKLTPVATGVQRAETPGGQTDQAFARTLRAAGLNVQPNFIYHALGMVDDPGFPGNSGLLVGQFKMFQTYLTRTRVPQAWNTLAICGLTPQGALTAMVDTPLDSAHSELKNRITVGAARLPAATGTGHGTAGAGLIAANTNNGSGLSGIVWNAQLLSEEVLAADGGTTSQIALGIDDAVSRGARVINLSLGEPGNSGDTVLTNSILKAQQSAVVVVAAGNRPDQGVYYPANLPGVIAVGSTGSSDSALACYSARPGNGIDRTLDIVAPGGAGYEGGCDGATLDQDLLLLAPNNSYILDAGTSFAAPQVSAVAALMRAANPKLTASQTRALLIGSVNWASGLPLLDANAAVKAALRAN
ncbi:S8 family serine peptidase [Deinococcus sp.]|uniref:S8 family peptidase n=1 Tax=Deinococcus sp. TaxID=47478 RepID=UPI0025C532B0|nr:S8 family serine peptidase [Deinococcus sp.]